MRRAAIAGAVLAFALAPAAAARTRRAFVRVDQVGYAPAQAKRAYLMSSSPIGGAAFEVRRVADGSLAYSGHAGAPLGSWSSRFQHVYPLDFDALQAPGSYTIEVGAARSPPFAIAAPASLYGAPLANALSFYRNERDGPEFIPSALRSAAGHLNDEQAETYVTPAVDEEGAFSGDLEGLGTTIDAAGGWWDAGDYLKFVQTTGYTVDLLLAGVRDFPAELGAGAGGSDFSGEARFGVEWLLRMWDDTSGTLYYQVGIGTGNDSTVSDHDIWRLPQEDDTYGGSDPLYRYIRRRPVFRAGPPGSPVSPNLAGRDAAAFALCFQVYARTLPALAERCLRAAEHIFALADTDPHGPLLTVIPFGFYPEREWRDDLELGAAELALALQSGAPLPGGLEHPEASFYLDEAARWAHAFIRGARKQGESDPLNLYDVSGLAHFDLVRAIRAAGAPTGLAVSEARLVGDLHRQLQDALAIAHRDPFGFGFPWATADTASHASGLSVMASEYDWLTGDERYATYAERWLANVLGANAWGSSFIIGDGTVFPHCPQHQVANLAGSLDGGAPVLAGAVVEGPSDEPSRGLVANMRVCPPEGSLHLGRFDGGGAIYKDNVQSYTTVEPAIDLSASSVLAFSWQVAAPASLGF